VAEITTEKIYNAFMVEPRRTEWRMTWEDAEHVWRLFRPRSSVPGVALLLLGLPVIIDSEAPPFSEQLNG
jgi:hypothetical protein